MATEQRVKAQGLAELAAVRAESRGVFWAVFVFGLFVNALMLTGPLYMLQVYDRVLGSKSVETLVALTLLVGFLYLMMGVLDYVRGRVLARVGARVQARLDGRVFEALMRQALQRPAKVAGATGLRDLEAVQRLLSSPVLLALFDIPWTPLFLAAIFLFHPWLGWLALTGGLVLIGVALLNQSVTRRPAAEAAGAGRVSDHLADQIRFDAETVQSMGMQQTAFQRWTAARDQALEQAMAVSDRSGGFQALTKTLRLFLQSAMLGLGAYLALQGAVSPGAMIAASILMGRALAPVDQALGGWGQVEAARAGWARLATLLGEVPVMAPRTALPRPKALLVADQVTVVPPGDSHAALRLVSFRLEPGQALGVIGPSGAGKSTLARAITGVWRPAGGRVRLDGAALDQFDPDALGAVIGYLPQRVALFDGTIAENIARLAAAPDDRAVVAAAQKAAAHEMILRLPEGYQTWVSAQGCRLSGGQIQRIGLARALYGDPVLLVLDEPNANLDNAGSEALNEAIRITKATGAAVVVMAHRPAAIEACDMLLMLEGGVRRAYGPRDVVLQQTVENHEDIQIRRLRGGGVA